MTAMIYINGYVMYAFNGNCGVDIPISSMNRAQVEMGFLSSLVGIVGAAGYAAGELIRVLLNHPQAEIVFANSGSNAGNLFSDVHEGLLGDTDLRFTDELPFEKIDVLFICLGHGKSEEFLKNNPVPANVKIIDFAQDFRIAAPGTRLVRFVR